MRAFPEARYFGMAGFQSRNADRHGEAFWQDLCAARAGKTPN
jgi:hypothetical protein